MIRFFRTLRKQLLKENKTGKYLKYALGEVILVMIGILLALQVNTWNQQRLERQEEQAILKNLKTDFTNAISEFEFLNSIRDSMQKGANRIYNITKTNFNTYTISQLDRIVSSIISVPTYNNQSSSLDVLFSSGRINLISNSTIKNYLLSWPGEVEDMIEGELQNANLMIDLQSIMSLYISYQNLSQYFDFKNVNTTIVHNQDWIDSDYIGLYEDKRFINTIARIEYLNKIAIIETDALIERAKNIIALIDIELTK